ncbi:hypothetical protein F0169_26125 [Pseudomonas sp. MAFF 212408]|uniref:Uncharacterized protein n=1 Tax=Pseudomonas kitaguniensis TaxID=2607908 RepID=A0A5N7KSU2_9PSED|nr:hypothetical protein [Pseudomonas kitaguniensis]MPR05244.1 hypothetical protein [Pseudomonas kitaguniensis]
MQNQKVIKWQVWGLLIVCLAQALYIYVSSPFRPDPSKVVSVTKVAEGGAIYEVLYDSGGATNGDVYRYFLMEIQPSEEVALKKTKNSTPFLVAKSDNAVKKVVGDRVMLKTNDTVYEFHSISLFKIKGEIRTVGFDLDATVP